MNKEQKKENYHGSNRRDSSRYDKRASSRFEKKSAAGAKTDFAPAQSKDTEEREIRGGAIPAENLIAGKNSLFAALSAGREINKIFLSERLDPALTGKIKAMARERGIPLVQVSTAKLTAMAGEIVHQGILATAAPVPYYEIKDILDYAESKKEKPFIFVLDGIQDPQNLGAIIRIADAAGAHGVIIPKRRGAPLTAAAMRASAGAGEFVRICRQSSLAQAVGQLKKAGIWLYAADMKGDQPYFQAPFGGDGVALVIGGEDTGVSRLVLEACDFTVSMPMYGQVSSLNAATSAAILAYKVVEARQKENMRGGKA